MQEGLKKTDGFQSEKGRIKGLNGRAEVGFKGRKK
jgi:hypothetical protein